MATKLLLVDDEPEDLEFLEQLFGDAGYETIAASDGVAGLREFFVLRPDLAIVDLLMPNMDGFELCHRIREISHIPLIVLTGLDQPGEKVQAFSAGVDDYVTKPVSGRELVARVEACLRRSQWPPAADDSSVYSDPLLMVDHMRREVYVGGESRELTPIEYSLLSLLLQRPGEALSLEYLLTNVWGKEYDTFDLVKWHISNLRKKLIDGRNKKGNEATSPIVTIRGYGYRYQKPVNKPTNISPTYSDPNLRVDLTQHKVSLNRRLVKLTGTEFALFSLFLEKPGQDLATEYLFKCVWGNQDYAPELVRWHIGNLRHKLGKNRSNHRYIVTIPGRGYSFVPYSRN